MSTDKIIAREDRFGISIEIGDIISKNPAAQDWDTEVLIKEALARMEEKKNLRIQESSKPRPEPEMTV
jgi:hypothetical protein